VTLNNLDLSKDSLLPLVIGTGFDDPYPIYDYLRTTQPVYRDASGVWLVSSHALVMHLLAHPHISSKPLVPDHLSDNGIGYLDMLMFQSGDQYKHLRTLLAPLFGKKRLADLQQFVDAEILRLLAPLQHKERFDLTADVARMLPMRTTCYLLGLPESAVGSCFSAAAAGTCLFSSPETVGAERYARATEEIRQFLNQIESLIAGLGPHTAPDHPLLYFRNLEENGELGHREMLLNILQIFLAGYGTTSMSIGSCVAAALRHPDIWQALRADAGLIPQAVREFQRYDPVLQSILRHAHEDIEVNGQTIRRGDKLGLLIGAANRDPLAFPRPNQLDLYRTSGRELTYSTGPHNCIGQMLAKMQIESLLRALLQYMPDLTLMETQCQRVQRGSAHGMSRLWLEHQVEHQQAVCA